MNKTTKDPFAWLRASINRSQHEVFSETHLVDPGLAEIILSANPDNRSLREAKIAQLVSDIVNDKFVFNGEPIIIAKNGELNDGQHRLEAIRRSGKAQKLLFVFGIERETRTTLDQGAPRSAASYLQMQGVANGALLSSTTRIIIAFERNLDKKGLGRPGEISAGDVTRRAAEDKTIQTSARYTANYSRRVKGMAATSVIAACHNILLKIDVQDGKAFMDMLVLGENIARDDPAFKARDRLRGLAHRSKTTQMEIIFRAWNAYREKRTLTSIPVHGRFPELEINPDQLLKELPND